MKLDLHYLKYELKGYLISDFKSREIMELLNDLEPEKYLQEYVLSLKLQDENKEKVSLRLRHILENAKKLISLWVSNLNLIQTQKRHILQNSVI